LVLKRIGSFALAIERISITPHEKRYAEGNDIPVVLLEPIARKRTFYATKK